MSPDTAIGLAILAPLLGAVGIQITGKWPNVRETVTLIAAFIAFGCVLSLVSGVVLCSCRTLQRQRGSPCVFVVCARMCRPAA